MGKKILAIIPARGGSKGIPFKNLQKIGGRPLVKWALNTALNTRGIDRIIVSTDSEKIIRIAGRKYAPFKRPVELAADSTPSLPVFQHALHWAEKEDKCIYKYIVVLEPTCPFRLPVHVRAGIDLAIKTNSSSIMSLVRVSNGHPVRIKRLSPNRKIRPFCIPEPEGLRRQDQEPAYIRNGAVYVFKRETIVNNRLWGDNPYGFEMDRKLYGINIDEPLDLMLAREFYSAMKKENRLNLIDSFVQGGR